MSIDSLTGGPTEYHFQQLFEQRLSQQNLPCALLYINIKHFSSINAIYGRETGDTVLQQVYEIFCSQLEPREFLSHIYADTYLLLLNVSTSEELEKRIIQLDDAVYTYKAFEEVNHIFFSMGGYLVTKATDTYANAVDCANYSRNHSLDINDENTSYEIYDYTIKDIRGRSITLLKRCYAALEEGHFEVYIQPKYELEQETIAGGEALIRWNDPEEGMIPLYEFMPPFEQSGFIRKIDYFLFNRVLEFLQHRLDCGQSVVPISVNLSKSHFSSLTFFKDKFLPIFETYHVPANLIEFEIPESLLIDDCKRIQEFVKQLNQYGFSCSLDDFGSGYSCLNTIKNIPVSTLKLDQKMFTEDSKERGKIVVKGILEIAKGLKMNVVSEGVETREYVDFLKNNHAGWVQGYYFSRPIPMQDFEKLLP